MRGRTVRAAAAASLTAEEPTDLASVASVQTYRRGEKIVASGATAMLLFFLRSGAVHVTLPDGVRLATLTAGMAFGEMPPLETHRSANVLADRAVTACAIRLRHFEHFRKQHPMASERIWRNPA